MKNKTKTKKIEVPLENLIAGLLVSFSMGLLLQPIINNLL